jgi:hypothetical protein
MLKYLYKALGYKGGDFSRAFPFFLFLTRLMDVISYFCAEKPSPNRAKTYSFLLIC